jgi:bifunctional DNA-binding transcriptional regulator/antitoxin component of YhaV-PrlF toxin-antitoxin module
MPTLTLRKLIKFGDGGVVVTVPRGWVRYYGLKAGDRLEVIADGELRIRPVREESSGSRVDGATG